MYASHRPVTVAAVAVMALGLAGPTSASEFGEVGLGTQFLVVAGDGGSSAGVGFDLRGRFLYVLGVDFSAASINGNEAVWGPSAYRLGFVIQAVTTEYFALYLSPGMSGDTIGDTFNPGGDTTWFRLGGGLEIRLDRFALGFDVHWTVPGKNQIETYVDEHEEELLAEYAGGLGTSGEVPPDPASMSTGELLDVLPLDRFEFTIGLRYYFF